jgi:hypothetical protein
MLPAQIRRSRVIALLLAVGLVITTAAVPVYAEEPIDIAKLEKLVYGKTYTGTYLDRLSRLERDLYGSERQGAIPARSTELAFKVSDSPSAESLWLQLRAVEWKSSQPIIETNLMEKLAAMETYLFGETQTGPIIKRVEQLISLWFVGGAIPQREVVVPEGTVLDLRLLEEVSSETAKAGQVARLVVTTNVVVDGVVVVPAGSIAELTVKDAVAGSHAFKKAKLDVELKSVKAIDGTLISLVPASQDGSVASTDVNQDQTTQLAVGASIAGLVLLGPIGAAAGFLVRADQIVLPADLAVRAAVKADSPVLGVEALPVVK